MPLPVFYPFKTRVHTGYASTLASSTAPAGCIVQARGYVLGGQAFNLGTSTSTMGAVTMQWQLNNTAIAGSTGVSQVSTAAQTVGGVVFSLAPTVKTYVNAGDVLTAAALGGSAVPFGATWVIREF